MFWVYTEDFVCAFIGPFETKAAAQQHIDGVCTPRGDSGKSEVITQNKFNELSPGWMIVTPEEDREFDPNA